MSKEFDEFDEFTGTNAQDDPEFRTEGGDHSADGLSELESFEADLAAAEVDDDEQLQGLDYDNFVILKKQELLKFLRAVEPWVKIAVDQYGKSVRIRSVSKDQVEFSYINGQVQVTALITNRSGKEIPTYFIQVSTLKRIVTETYASLVLVHENDELNMAILDQILYIETITLKDEEYKPVQIPEKLSKVDVEVLQLLTKKLSFVLAATDRVAEKVINYKEDKAYISTAVFAAAVKNPFEFDDMSISKICMDLLGIMTEVSKLTFNCAIVQGEGRERLLVCEVDGLWTVAMPVFELNKTLVERAKEVTEFTGTMEVSNEALSKIVDLSKSLEYLSEVLEFQVVKDNLQVTVRSKDLSRKIPYMFPFNGEPETSDEVVRVSATIVKPYLHLGANTTSHAFTKAGWGLQTEWGNILIRKTV